MTILKRVLWVVLVVGVTLAAARAALIHEVRSSGTSDSEEDLWPDPREREGFRLGGLRNALYGYAGANADTLPADLLTLVGWIPTESRAAVASWTVDLWGTPVYYEPVGRLAFTLRSAGADRAWRTADDVFVFEARTTPGSADTPRSDSASASRR